MPSPVVLRATPAFLHACSSLHRADGSESHRGDPCATDPAVVLLMGQFTAQWRPACAMGGKQQRFVCRTVACFPVSVFTRRRFFSLKTGRLCVVLVTSAVQHLLNARLKTVINQSFFIILQPFSLTPLGIFSGFPPLPIIIASQRPTFSLLSFKRANEYSTSNAAKPPPSPRIRADTLNTRVHRHVNK